MCASYTINCVYFCRLLIPNFDKYPSYIFPSKFYYLRSSLIQRNCFQITLYLFCYHFRVHCQLTFFISTDCIFVINSKYRVKCPYRWNVGSLLGFPCHSRNHADLLQ
jgi:hypothetical protein